MKMNIVDWVAFVLVFIGGINWGLWGGFEFDLVSEIFGGNTETAAKVVYILVGVSALYLFISMIAKVSGTKEMKMEQPQQTQQPM